MDTIIQVKLPPTWPYPAPDWCQFYFEADATLNNAQRVHKVCTLCMLNSQGCTDMQHIINIQANHEPR